MGSRKNKSVAPAMDPVQFHKDKDDGHHKGAQKHFDWFGKKSKMKKNPSSLTENSIEHEATIGNKAIMVALVDEWNRCEQECNEYKRELFCHIQAQVHDCERKLEKVERKWAKLSMDEMRKLQTDIEECIVVRKRELFKVKTVNQTTDKWNLFAGRLFAIGRVNLKHCEDDLKICEQTIDTMSERRPALASHMIFRMSGDVNMRLRRLSQELNKLEKLNAFHDRLVNVREKIVKKHGSPDWPKGLVAEYLEMCDRFDILYDHIGEIAEYDTAEVIDRMEQALCIIEKRIPD